MIRSLTLVALCLAGCGKSPPEPSPPTQVASGSSSASARSATPAIPDAAPSVVTANVAPGETLAVPNRPLTEGEIAMIRPIFRDGIDYTRVRVIDNSFPLQPENVYMTPRGHIYAPGSLYADDFSKQSFGIRAVFVHEMTHVWQFENGMDLIAKGAVEMLKYRGDYERAYAYELSKERDLTEYGMEQQASIVEDYFDITAQHGSAGRMTNTARSAAERDALFAAVLANFLHDARYARSLDPAQIAAQHAKSAQEKQPGPEACAESEQEHGTAHMCSWRYQDTSH